MAFIETEKPIKISEYPDLRSRVLAKRGAPKSLRLIGLIDPIDKNYFKRNAKEKNNLAVMLDLGTSDLDEPDPVA